MEKITPEELKTKNENLKETSKLIFGESAELRIVNPATLQLLKHNARYFKKDQFKQLVSNVKNDKRLSSVPLCMQLQNEKLEVLSGNHRVEASVEAKLEHILVIVITSDVSESEKIAIQISHNSLVGEDDDQILADLWSKIDDIKMKCYAGLSSEIVEKLDKIKLVSFSTPQVRTKQFSFAFTEMEAELVTDVMEELAKIPADVIYVAPMEQFTDFFDLIQQIKQKKNIKNGSLAILKMIELAATQLDSDPEATV